MFKKFWKTISFFAFVFLGAVFLIFVSLLPAKNQKSLQNQANPYPQADIGDVQKQKSPFITIKPSKELEQSMQENPNLKSVYNYLESYKKIASTLVVSESAVTPTTEDQQIIENLFPKYYIEGLKKIQDTFVSIGWMRQDEAADLRSEQGVFKFLEKLVEIFAEKGFYTPQQAENARRVVTGYFPQMWKTEREILRNRQTSYMPKKEIINGVDVQLYEAKRKDILDGILSILIPRAASAQALGDDFVTLPDCWKSKTIPNPKGGTNLFAPCCNCGLWCGYGCTFYWDCGRNASKCNVHLGCLNSDAFCGPADQWNAIFDGPPGYEVPATRGWGSGTNFDYSMTCGCDKR